MFTNKKGSEMSMNVIIIAAIALLILVILSVMIINSGGKINEGTSCVGGNCMYEADCEAQGGFANPASGCSDGEVCCVVVGGNDR